MFFLELSATTRMYCGSPRGQFPEAPLTPGVDHLKHTSITRVDMMPNRTHNPTCGVDVLTVHSSRVAEHYLDGRLTGSSQQRCTLQANTRLH